MAWKLKINSILIIVFLSVLSEGKEQKNCGKAWVSLPLMAVFQNGHMIEFKNADSGKTSKVQIKDFKANLIKQFVVPHKIDSIYSQEAAGDDLVYFSEGRLYHFDPKKNREQEISQKTTTQLPCYGSSEEGSSLLKSCESDDNNGGSNSFVYDFKTQKQLTVPSIKNTAENGQTIAFPSVGNDPKSFSKVSIYNFANGKNIEVEVPLSKNIIFRSDKHIEFEAANVEDSRKITHLVKIDDRWVKYTNSKTRLFNGVLSSGEKMFATVKHREGKDVEINADNFNEFKINTEIYDITGKHKIKTIDGAYTNSLGSKAIYKVEFPIKFSVFSEKSFKQLVAGQAIKPAIVSANYSPSSENGKWGLRIDQEKDETDLVNLESGKYFKLPYMSSGRIKVAKNGSNIAVYDSSAGNTPKYIVDTVTGKIRSFESGHISLFDKDFVNWTQWHDGNERLEEVCFSDSIKVIEDEDCSQCKSSQVNNLSNAKDVFLTLLCRADEFKAKEWDKITPPIKAGTISNQQAILYLKRFQKDQGYDPKIHFELLSAILKSELVESSPALINETLKSLSASNPSLVRSVYNVLKIDKRMPAQYGSDESVICRSTQDNLKIESALQGLKMKAANVYLKTTTEDWLAYKPFKNEFQKLPVEQRNAIVDGIAESLSQAASRSVDLDGIFQSKLYYFSKKFALDLVGDKVKPATDLAIAVRNGKSTPIILGSGDLEGAKFTRMEDSVGTESPYGFSYKVLEPIVVPKDAHEGATFTQKLNWKHMDDSFSADTKMTVLAPLGELIAKDKQPNYSALRKDGKLTGMMVIGSNLSSGRAGLVDQYLTYYQNQGFEFKEAKAIDAISFFKNSVKNGEVDYLIKEAHSDGDERNLFRAYEAGKLFEGTLVKKDGVKEVVYLLAPDLTKSEDRLISNQEFGSWIRSRQQDQPLVYFNASCGSTRKVIAEIAASHSANFVPIPTSSSVLTFSDKDANGTRQMLQAFREDKSYEEIRAALQKTANYQKGEDHYIFPDENDYDEQIRKNLQMNIDVEVSIKDKDNKELHSDQSIDH